MKIKKITRLLKVLDSILVVGTFSQINKFSDTLIIKYTAGTTISLDRHELYALFDECLKNEVVYIFAQPIMEYKSLREIIYSVLGSQTKFSGKLVICWDIKYKIPTELMELVNVITFLPKE